MLSAACFGSIFGAVFGPYISIDSRSFGWMQLMIMSLLVLSVFIFIKSPKTNPLNLCVSSAIVSVLSAAWVAIHNPAPVSRFNKDLEVVWSIGCAESDREILVHDGGNLYMARGSALGGDIVSLSENYFKSRFSIVNTSGYRASPGPICQAFEVIRAHIYTALNAFPMDMKFWLGGFALGKSSDVDKGLIETFRRVGLLHVLVLSGGHLSVIATMLLIGLRLPFLVFYFLRRLRSDRWVYVWNVTAVVAVLLLFVFCAVVGFTQSVQRSFLNFCVYHVVSMIGLAQDTKTKIKLTFCLQAIIFPVNLLSLSLILSWSGTLILHAFYESTYLKSRIEVFAQIVKIQLLFFASTLVFFGQAGILSPIANLIALPVLGLLLPMDLVGIMLNISSLNEYLTLINRAVIRGVRLIDHYQSLLPLSHVRLPSEFSFDAFIGRIVIVLAIIVLFLLSGIRQQDESFRSKDVLD